MIEGNYLHGVALKRLQQRAVLRLHFFLCREIQPGHLEFFQRHEAVDLVYLRAGLEKDDAVGFVAGAGGPHGHHKTARELVARPIGNLRLIDGKLVTVRGIKPWPRQRVEVH